MREEIRLTTLARSLVQGAILELYLTPKPGLVDRHDAGAHPDLSLVIMRRSIDLVAHYLGELVVSLSNNESFDCQKAIAINAEHRLYKQLGTNTHKGFIFLSGMLLIAYSRVETLAEPTLRQSLGELAASFFNSSKQEGTHGQNVRNKFHTGGVIHEAMAGYPSVFEIALPAFRAQKQRGKNGAQGRDLAAFYMMARLMQCVDDTTTLHRGGLPGLARLKSDVALLEKKILAGEDPASWLETLNQNYIAANLTQGGVADLLGVGFGYLLATGEISFSIKDRLIDWRIRS